MTERKALRRYYD